MIKLQIIALALILAACGGDKDPSGPVDIADYHTPDISRPAYRHVITQEPMVSGLMVGIYPTAEIVRDYFGPWGATFLNTHSHSLPWIVGEFKKFRPNLKYGAWLELDGTSNGALIGGYLDPSHRIFYQIGDEPSRGGNSMEKMQQAESTAAKVKAVDPGALIMINLKDSDDFDEIVEYIGPWTDILSFSAYGTKDYGYLNAVRRYGLRYSMPTHAYLDLYCSDGRSCGLSEISVRTSMYNVLTYGFTSISSFIYKIDNCSTPHHDNIRSVMYEAPCDNWARTDYWHLMAGLNREAREILQVTKQCVSLGVRYMGPSESNNVQTYKADEFEFIDTISSDVPLLIGFFKHFISEELCVIVQNVDMNAYGAVTVNGRSIVLKPGEGGLVK